MEPEITSLATAQAHRLQAAELRRSNRLDEAEQLLLTAMAVAPDDPDCFVEFAVCAIHCQHRTEAIMRLELVVDRFPDCLEAYSLLAHQLATDGRLDQAEDVIQKGAALFPGHPQILWHWAKSATRRHDWQEAARRWDIARALHPNNARLADGAADFRMAVQLQATASNSSIGDQSAPEPPLDEPSAASALLLRFESLGNNCEFGIVQRVAGIEPLGLLRWAIAMPENLARLLETRLEGVGEPQFTQLAVNNRADSGAGEYFLEDRRYFRMHTFINAHLATQDELMPKMLRRLQFLKDKLIEDLAEGEKIFVYKTHEEPADDADAARLFDAIRLYGPGRLFFVRKPHAHEQDNTVEEVRDGLLIGRLSKLNADPFAGRERFADWVALCRAAQAVVSA